MNLKFSTLTIATVLGTSSLPTFAQGAAKPATTQMSTTKVTNLIPIFQAPLDSKITYATFLVSRNQSIVTNTNWSAQANAARMKEIQQIAKNYKLQKSGSPTALPLGETLLKLLQEHAYYLDNLKAYGITDRAFPNTDLSIRKAHAAVAAHATLLVRQFPKSGQVSQWKTEAFISNLRTNEPNAAQNALAHARSVKGQDGFRILALGVLLDRAKGSNTSSFGSLEKSLDFEVDVLTKSVLTLFAAESQQNKKSALANYQEAARLALPYRGPNGATNPVVLRSVSKGVSLALETNTQTIDPEIVSFVQSMGANSAGHHYAEQIALRTLKRQPRQAISFYQEILAHPGISAQQKLFVEHRGLEIAINANDCESASDQWDRIGKIPNAMSVTGAHDRVVATQNICWRAVEKQASAENVDRFVRLHDAFMPLSTAYAKDDAWKLKAVDALFRAKNDDASAKRADALVFSSTKPAIQTQALRFACKARERILQIPPKPDFNRARKINNEDVVTDYIKNLDKMAKIGSPVEKSDSVFQAAYLLHQIEKTIDARQRFESAMTLHAKNPLASQSASYLLEINLASKDHVYTERIARHTEKLHITPANKAHANLRGIIENAVWEQAEGLAEKNQYEAAATRYIAYQKEFSATKRADTALNLATENFLKAQKTEPAIEQMEKLLAVYPKSSYAKETRWSAAEQSKNIKQHQRSAGHYEQFNKSWPQEGLARRALYKAAEMQRQAGRYAHAATDFEAYFSQTSSKPERIRTAKDIASLHTQFGKTTDALGALERVIKISGTPEDEFWARSRIFDIRVQQAKPALIREAAQKLTSLAPSGEEGSRAQARAKYQLGKLDAVEARAQNPMASAQLLKAIQDLMKHYESAKTNLLSPCGALPEWCAVGMYETSKLAEDINKILLDVEPPPTINPKEADKVQSLKLSSNEKLQKDRKDYAEQAEAAITGGVPDLDWADTIREWSQKQRGENQTVEPMYK
jgi:outer membrane protein assembly factor BamD (BamD/ComL family)